MIRGDAVPLSLFTFHGVPMTASARSIAFVVLSLSLLAASAGAGDPNTYSAQSKALMAEGQYYKALDELKSGFSLFPYNETLRHDLAAAYAQIAQRHLKQGRYPEAAEFFGQARDLYPAELRFTLMRGIALYLDKRYDAARAELVLAGEGVEPILYLGKISYDTGDLPAALAQWRRGLELEPGNNALKELIGKAERELPVESKMDKGYSSMFDISYDAELPPGLAAEVLDALESAYNSVGADLGLFPTTRIPVLLYTKSDYSSVTAGPDWSGGLYDGKIRLPVGGVTKMNAHLRGILFHEFTHVLVAELTRGNIPTWLNEGLAQIEERKEFAAPAAGPTRANQGGHLLPLSALSGSFISLDRSQAGLAYQQSYSMTSFMVTRYGWYAMQGILKSLGERSTLELAVTKSLSDWSLDLPGVMREWREALPSGAAE
jgi:tetratricopeptide (TPR) repeat protein